MFGSKRPMKLPFMPQNQTRPWSSATGSRMKSFGQGVSHSVMGTAGSAAGCWANAGVASARNARDSRHGHDRVRVDRDIHLRRPPVPGFSLLHSPASASAARSPSSTAPSAAAQERHRHHDQGRQRAPDVEGRRLHLPQRRVDRDVVGVGGRIAAGEQRLVGARGAKPLLLESGDELLSQRVVLQQRAALQAEIRPENMRSGRNITRTASSITTAAGSFTTSSVAPS